MPIVKMTDLQLAYVVWRKHHMHLTGPARRRGFSQYLDDVMPIYLGASGVWELTAPAEHRMQMLLGPHAYAVIRAYYAKQGPSVEVDQNFFTHLTGEFEK